MNRKLSVDHAYEAWIIKGMKMTASASGVEAEVMRSYDEYRKSGQTPEEASWSALYDWDCA